MNLIDPSDERRAKLLRVEDPHRLLPPGRMCRDCVHVAGCLADGVTFERRLWCATSPSRFAERPKAKG